MSIFCTFCVNFWGYKVYETDQCNFSSKSKRGLKVHIGRSHKDIQTPECLRGGELENSLNISELSENREEGSSLVKADHSALSLTPLKEMINDSVSESTTDDSEDEVEPPHKCPPFVTLQQSRVQAEVSRRKAKRCSWKTMQELWCKDIQVRVLFRRIGSLSWLLWWVGSLLVLN